MVIEIMLPRLFLATLLLTTLSLASAVPNRALAEPASSESEQRSWKAVGLVGGGTGLMFLAGAAAYKSAADYDLDAAAAGAMVDQERKLRGEEREHTAVVLGIVGASALVGGALAYYLGSRKSGHDPKAVHVTPVLLPTAGQGRASGLAISAIF